MKNILKEFDEKFKFHSVACKKHKEGCSYSCNHYRFKSFLKKSLEKYGEEMKQQGREELKPPTTPEALNHNPSECSDTCGFCGGNK